MHSAILCTLPSCFVHTPLDFNAVDYNLPGLCLKIKRAVRSSFRIWCMVATFSLWGKMRIGKIYFYEFQCYAMRKVWKKKRKNVDDDDDWTTLFYAAAGCFWAGGIRIERSEELISGKKLRVENVKKHSMKNFSSGEWEKKDEIFFL